MVHERENDQSGGGGGGYSRSSKKPKLPKAPPQRGLGVARLEKMLREHHRPHDFPITAPPLMTPPPPPPPPMTPINSLSPVNSITRNVPLIRNIDPFTPPPLPMTALSGSNSNNSPNDGDGDGDGDVGGVCEVGATMLNSRDQNPTDSGFPFPFYFLDKFDPFWPSNMCNSMSSALSSSWSSSSSIGMHQDIEPPSNQKSYNYKSMWPKESKMIGIKRQWPFALEKIPSCFTHLYKSEPQCSCGIQSISNPEPFREISRDPKKGIVDFETPDSSFLTLGPLSTSSLSTDAFDGEVYEFESIPLLGGIGVPQQWSGQGEPRHPKTFYSFFPPKGHECEVKTTSSLNNSRGDEAAEDSIDLNLKISVGK